MTACSTASAAAAVAPCAGAKRANARPIRRPAARAIRRRTRIGICGGRGVVDRRQRFLPSADWRNQRHESSPLSGARTRSGDSSAHAARIRQPAAKDDTPSLLVAPRGSEAEQLGRRFARHSPILVFFLTTLAGDPLLAAAMIGLGFLLVGRGAAGARDSALRPSRVPRTPTSRPIPERSGESGSRGRARGPKRDAARLHDWRPAIRVQAP